VRVPGTTFYPAAASNQTKGRTAPIRFFTVHHSAGWEQTLRYLWADPARNGSSHLYVSGAVREQYVDTNDTAWTNGNWQSNCESITCETRGDWRNGYYDQATLDNLSEVMYQCLKLYPQLQLTYHKDVSSSVTLCPADLKDKGYAATAWNKAKARIAAENAPAPTPTPAPAQKLSYSQITPKRVELIRTANLWNFNFTEWSKAQAANPAEFANGYPQGYTIDVVAEATNALGGKYYMTAYSYNQGNIRATNGFNVKDTKDYVPPAPTVPTPPVTPPTPPVIEPTKPPVPTVPPVVPVPEVPIDTDPTVPGSGDIEKRLGILEAIVKTIVDFLSGLFSGFKK